MSDLLERWEETKRRLERAKAEESRRQGSLDSLTRRLKEEYGVTVKEGEKELVTLEKKVTRLDRELAEKVEEIEEVIE